MKKYVWKPIDIGKLRLYQVKITFSGHHDWNSINIVLARNATQARELIKNAFKDSEWFTIPEFKAEKLDVYQPEDNGDD